MAGCFEEFVQIGEVYQVRGYVEFGDFLEEFEERGLSFREWPNVVSVRVQESYVPLKSFFGLRVSQF